MAGGSIQSVTLDGATFSVAFDVDSGRKLGGFENANEMNGDGTSRMIKTRVGWMLSDLAVSIDDDAGDAEILQELINRNTFYPVSITYASGKVYQGTGQVTGENPTASQATTAAIALEGPGELTPQ